MGLLSLKLRRWLNEDSASPEVAHPKGDASCQATDSTTDEPTASDIAAALKTNAEVRTQYVLVVVGLGVLIYAAWSFQLGAVELARRGETPGADPWDSFPASGWALGLSTQLASTFVFAALALVAVLTVASASTRGPDRGSDASVIAGWAGWLRTLAWVSLITSALGFAIAGSQVMTSPRSSVLLLLSALLICWLSSGIQTQADDRIAAAHHEMGKQQLIALRQRIKDKLPDIETRRRRKLVLPALLAPVVVALLSSLTFLVVGLMIQDYPVAALVGAWGQWLIILTVCVAILLPTAAPFWSMRRWSRALVGTLVVAIVVAEAWFFALLVVNATGTLTSTLWVALAMWLTLTALMWSVPRWNPIAQLLFINYWRRSEKQLAVLETEMKKQKERRRPCQCC